MPISKGHIDHFVRGSLLAKRSVKPADILRLYAQVASKLPPTRFVCALTDRY